MRYILIILLIPILSYSFFFNPILKLIIMPVPTRQQIIKLFNNFKEKDVAFNNHVIEATGLLPKQIFLKISNTKVPCILYSTSMISARIIANLSPELFEKIRAARNTVYLRFAFKRSDRTDALKFFISSKVTGFNPYSNNNPHTNFITLNYSQTPPDDLIKILGGLLTVKANAMLRKEERIPITTESLEKLGFKDRNAIILVQEVPRKCILRDISFSGAKILIIGLGKFLINKEAVLRLSIVDVSKPVDIKGKIIRTEQVKGRKDISALALKFNEENKSLSFIQCINNFFS